MNSNPNQTSLPNPIAEVGQFQQHLRSLVAQTFSGNRIPDAERRWNTIILGLSDNFCASFLLPGSITWNALKEKITILETTLEAIYLASLHVEGIFSGKRDGVGVLVVRLLNICNGLDVWLDSQVEIEDGLPSPATLREKAFKALVGVLRSLGGNVTRIEQPEEPRWKILRSLLNECIELVSDILSNPTSITMPLTITFFKRPRLEAKQTSMFNADPQNVHTELSITTYSQLAALLALLLDTLTHTLYPPVLSQYFLSDVTLGLHKTFNLLFNYLLSTTCSLNAAARANIFSTLISSASLLCEYSAFTEQFSHLAFHLLQFRVLQDSESVCSDFDQVVMKAINLQSKATVDEAAANEVVRLLCTESSEQLSLI
ncbi:hypothetical protein F5887DRAFT_116131 [Amanita rubescens]|nr:hypothetical protein F5887DRAFT_116131 [Amanita rubescens]